MYAQAALKPNTLLRNGACGIVMRGVQKCTCAGSSLRGRNSAPLCCIKLDTATDPACGTAGFPVSSSEHINDCYGSTMTAEDWESFSGKSFTGFDTDPTMLRISAMNLMLHSITHPDIEYMDSVSKSNNIMEKFNVILANPSFKGTVDAAAIHNNLTDIAKTKKTELLFIALFVRMLKPGGRCACIVPDGVLFGSSKAHVAVRKALVDNNVLTAVISMPSGVFKPYAGVSTAVLIFTKTGETDSVWFYDMKSDGFSLDNKRDDLGNSGDIDDIIARFRNLSVQQTLVWWMKAKQGGSKTALPGVKSL